ncbi:hypothetical protein NG895_15515 [Aeoliella sp. ICT_H6.2]|uniref:Uncharacterized protein n=1 Tax=Aeoliella straminimaris TaxID=2954799 RepID=A0A9X2FFG5_9BACT|nr:hypothetical protein [Aeoliella straminimaris]MCO6045319.1 hypothetical protein [Aeoliella straminimaris]
MSSGGKKSDPQQPPPKAASSGAGPSLAIRIAASIALAFHVFVLFLYPLANGRSSETISSMAGWPGFRWYAEPLYLNHGHGFFGPDPGAGFLIEYDIRDSDGEVVKQGKFPDPDTIWPRLRYHRYKMLADQPASSGPNLNLILEGYARQLLRQYGGESVTVNYIAHDILRHYDWLGDAERNIEGRTLDDKSLYSTRAQVRQSRADVEAADAALKSGTEEAPSPDGENSAPPEEIFGGRPQ